MSQFLEEDDDDFNLVIDNVEETYHNNNNIDWYAFWYNLSLNENAIEILEKYKSKIDWNGLSQNKNAIRILEKNEKNINFDELATNEGATNLLKKHYENEDNIRHDYLALNKSKYAMDLLEDIFEKYGISENENFELEEHIKYNLSTNESVHAINLMKKYPTKLINNKGISQNKNAMEIIQNINLDNIDWRKLSENENAVSILKQNPSKIVWSNLSKNKNAMDLLIENQDKINWSNLSRNENAVDFLKDHQDEIDWEMFSMNKNTDAIHFLKENQTKIIWHNLANNENKKAIPMLKKFLKIMMVYKPKRVFDELPSFDPTLKGFDFIEYSNYNVSIFLKKSPNNIAIILKNKEQTTAFLTKREYIKTIITNKDYYLYACKAASNNYRPENVETGTIYFKFSTIIPYTNTFVDVKEVVEMMKFTNGQVFELTNAKELVSVVSYDAFNRRPYSTTSIWSTCQPGQGGLAYKLTKVKDMYFFYEDIYPQIINKSKKITQIKKKECCQHYQEAIQKNG